MKYLLDTDHISILQQPSGREYATLSSRLALHSPDDLSVSVVSFHEQVLGCHTYISRARTVTRIIQGYSMLSRLLSDYAAVSILPYDAAAATEFDVLAARRLRIGTMDLRIGSIALSRRLILVTRNASDFRRVPGLKIEDWTV